MNITITDLTPEIKMLVSGTFGESPEKMLSKDDRLKHAVLTREEYRKEAMRQIKAALATFE